MVCTCTHKANNRNLAHELTVTDSKTSVFDRFKCINAESKISSTSALSMAENQILDSASGLSSDIIESLSKVDALRDNLKVDISNVMLIAKNKDQIVLAFEKLCSILVDYNDKLFSLHDQTQQNLLKILALKKDQEIYNGIRDVKIKSNSNAIQSLDMASNCEKDLKKVFITFTCPNELKHLQNSENLIRDVKHIFARMNIDMDMLGIMPIKSAFFQHIKIKDKYELALCVSFINAGIASYVRKKITFFNSNLYEKGKIDEMRYCERMYWSKNVWKILKIGWELKRLKMIDRVKVCSDGIIVHYAAKTMKLRCLNDVDNLRKEVHDLYSDVSCEIFYDDNYFTLRYEDRDKRRIKEIQMQQMALDSDDDLP